MIFLLEQNLSAKTKERTKLCINRITKVATEYPKVWLHTTPLMNHQAKYTIIINDSQKYSSGYQRCGLTLKVES